MLPIIVLAVVVIWFGFGRLPKIALVALFTFFTGLKVAITYSYVSAIVAELVAPSRASVSI